MPQEPKQPSSQDSLLSAIEKESHRFKDYYLWLEQAMPPMFFEDLSKENIMLVAHNLMGFDLQDFFSTIHLKNAALVICLDSADADLRILKNYSFYGIKNYQVYVSKIPVPFQNITANLRVAAIYFTEVVETTTIPVSLEAKDELRRLAREHIIRFDEPEFDKLVAGINSRFLGSLPVERLITAFEMFFRAQSRDNCQYKVHYNENWQKDGSASMNIVLAWRNTPKYNFLYRLARVINRHNLVMTRVNATYMNTYAQENILVMALELHGNQGQAAWDAADIPEFLRELFTVKYFASFDAFDTLLVSKGIISGTMANFLRSMSNFIHQTLVHVDANLYTFENIEEALCRHPELTTKLCEAFDLKFNPDSHDLTRYQKAREIFLTDLGKLDTGQEENDRRRKNVLRQGMNFIHHILKTNFFRTNLTAHCFRLDPEYLDDVPFEREAKFPVLPFAIFFIKGMHFIGFHIRFKDLARGGLRTVYPHHPEHVVHERNNIFSECYNLALTQHLKNKDIPEGGAKGILFINPFNRLDAESMVLQKELEVSGVIQEEIDKKIEIFRQDQRLKFLHQVQRSFVESLLTLVNCEPNGTIRAKHIVDYWKRPEYLYLGPDENMHDEMIQWIADLSEKYHYKPGGAFISSKPNAGINHKKYGVTSLGINVYMHAVLNFLNIDPNTTPFTIKMSGGPDGDVAGNQIYNLYRYYPKTARLLTLVDVSGTIYDPNGLDLAILAELFEAGKPIRYYPPEKLSIGGLLLDKATKHTKNPLTQQTLCWQRRINALEKTWLTGSETNNLLRNTINQTKTDIFIPAGGRPKTLDEANIKDFFDENNKPTARGIVEGANLYLTPKARRTLEKADVVIIKDSSANKTGVICSSYEVLCGLTLTDEEFLKHKPALVNEILERLKQCASNEAHLLLKTHKETGKYLTDISQQLSERINLFTYQLLDYLDSIPWSNHPSDPLTHCFLNYCLPTLRTHFHDRLLSEVPEHHKKAIVACYVASHTVYSRGLEWEPSIVEVLPIVIKQLLQS